MIGTSEIESTGLVGIGVAVAVGAVVGISAGVPVGAESCEGVDSWELCAPARVATGLGGTLDSGVTSRVGTSGVGADCRLSTGVVGAPVPSLDWHAVMMTKVANSKEKRKYLLFIS